MGKFRIFWSLLAIALAFAAVSASVFANTDTRRKVGTPIGTAVEKLRCLNGVDSCTYADKIEISGYAKALNDRDETFYVTNGTPFRISRLLIRFSYTNMKGEMLHEEEYDIACDIPPSETRRVSVRSWDSQRSHYYYKSRKPKRSATPYRASYTILRYDAAITVAE